MNKHELSLEVSEFCNANVLRIFDTSNYCDEDTLENYLVEVLPPQKSSFISFQVQRGFSLAVNSSSLQYRKVNFDNELRPLPDGIYEIKQSHKPNIHTVIEFYHLRTVDLRTKLKVQWSKLLRDDCKISPEEFYKNRDKLREIDEYALAAKYQIEECLHKREGKELYEWAVKLLERYTNQCQC